jgi:hypothetical protein
MKNRYFALLIAIVFCSCSSTNLVFISVLQPAPVTLPPGIKTVAVANRTEASNQVQAKVLNVAENILSFKGPNLDRDGAKESITGLTDELMKNNRFAEVKALNDVGPMRLASSPHRCHGIPSKGFAARTMPMPCLCWNCSIPIAKSTMPPFLSALRQR